VVEYENVRLEKQEGEYKGNFTFSVGASPFVAVLIIVNNVRVALVMFALGALLCVPWVVPLRIPLLALIFLGLAVDAGEGSLNSPLAPLGALLVHNLDQTVPIGVGVVPLLTVGLCLLLLVHLYRTLTGARADATRAAFARPMRIALAFPQRSINSR
jgi:hypothetical protein